MESHVISDDITRANTPFQYCNHIIDCSVQRTIRTRNYETTVCKMAGNGLGVFIGVKVIRFTTEY